MDIYVKTEVFNLKDHPKYNEKWVQEKITEDPSILGLGDLIVLNLAVVGWTYCYKIRPPTKVAGEESAIEDQGGMENTEDPTEEAEDEE